MRIISRQPEIDHRLSPHRGPWAFASDRPFTSGLTRMMISLVLSALVAQPSAAEKDKRVEEPESLSWYTQSYTRSDTGLTISYMWSSNSRFRSETVVRGHNLVTIVNGDTYYTYDALTMVGIAIRRAPAAQAADSPDRRPFGNEGQMLIDQGGEKIREENISGRIADVYQITDENGRRIAWMTQDDQRLPIRIEVFIRKSGSTRYKEYVDWIRGLPIADAFFEPEPGIQFQRFELDEYIKNAIAKDSAATLPILYQEMLHGPTAR